MEASSGLPDSPKEPPVIGGGDDHSVNLLTISPPDPLQPISHNQQREGPSLLSPKDGRDNSVAEKVSQFNSMALHAKQQERKTTDAALQRAVLGREEAEAEVRRLREEVKVLRQQVEEGKEREKKVSHRLEVVMEDYGRAKESLAHTQAIWEKEIRKARKEAFKAQSDIVELQKQLKSTRTALKTAETELHTSRAAQKAAEEELEQQKGRTQAREQEAIEARNVLAGLQEQLNKALEHINTLEMERDAFKALAKSEELARIAAEGKIPLPESKDVEMGGMEPPQPEDDFAALKSYIHHTADLSHSATSESEIEELKELWQWEKQRADRALELIAFMEVECNLKMCAGARAASKRPSIGGMDGAKRKWSEISPHKVTDAGDLVILRDASPSPCGDKVSPPSAKRTKTEQLRAESAKKSGQKSKVFLPEQGIFRTVSQEELDKLQVPAVPVNGAKEREGLYKRQRHQRTTDQSSRMADSRMGESQAWSEMQDSVMSRHRRTPDSDGVPDYVLDSERASLQSLLTAPHKRYAESISSDVMGNIPTIPASSVISSVMSGSVQTITASTATATTSIQQSHLNWEEPVLHSNSQEQKENVPPPQPRENEGAEGDRANSRSSHDSQKSQPQPPNHTPGPASRHIDHLSESKLGYSPSSLAHASMFGSTMNSSTITTKVPLKEASTNADLGMIFRTPSKGSVASATSENAMDIDGDINITKSRSESRGELPVSREEALAMIRERRERGRSREIKSRPQSPEKRPLSPVKRPASPEKQRPDSPEKRDRDRDPTPKKRDASPNKSGRAPSPNKRPESPSKRAPSPNKQRNASPTRRPLSPSKRTRSPSKARVISNDLSYAGVLKKSTDVMTTPGEGTRSFSAPTAATEARAAGKENQRGLKS
ncbi:hypothetical protein NEUTE1DRAFT_82979 [Neurospora tetrasperma FGSC 2508]|uniref:Uncharacterized protein n=1 Tax=Neurospora tetrasperma (strain FGSC 2508 / ATCC MYA-4615 / P0657) TaxID=510951 RepID=F8MR83_NEUT8|nr:uncharacterized protein NEUTE1DRAFT_82979 [Neurospora tetrasperma FGSC 2508]EGO56042.1 hypothetical protein NEUTE1DRAFT_82979 [Neurospora tetrasperma FGSC 2508]EGZ71109.1 hypothetical protein NEUTE2DRAFT_93096 [Neurospora tetrasperma FGSC 2509]